MEDVQEQGSVRTGGVPELPPAMRSSRQNGIPEQSSASKSVPELGLVCLNTELREREIFCSRTMRLASICAPGGLDKLRQKALANCRDLKSLIMWNDLHQIPALRLSSELFPHKSNPAAPSYDLEFAQPILAEVGQLARILGQRLTFHPGQYNVVATPREDVFAKTIADLDWHAEVLDRMGCDQHGVMVVHGGGLYGNKERTIERWVRNYWRLPERVRRRLVLENCEKNFNIEDCLRVSQMINIPVVFDTHHHACYQRLHPREALGDGAT